MTTIVKQQATVIRQHLSAQPDAVVEIVQTATSATSTSELIIEIAETPEQERQAWAAASLEGLDKWEEQHHR